MFRIDYGSSPYPINWYSKISFRIGFVSVSLASELPSQSGLKITG